jgi:hypothetical protein
MKYLNLFVEHAIEGERELAIAALRKAIAEKSFALIKEDHEKVMTKMEMTDLIKRLFKKADDDEKDQFLSKLAKAAGLKKCTEDDIEECASKIFSKGKKECDSVIHALEDLVDYHEERPKDKKYKSDDDHDDENDEHDDDDSDSDSFDKQK